MSDGGPGGDRLTRRQRAWAVVRLALGIAQMMGAVGTFYLLLQTGLSALSLGGVVITCLLTTTSVLLFGRRRG